MTRLLGFETQRQRAAPPPLLFKAKGGRGCAEAVRDDGDGISPSFLPFVFDRFRQADGTVGRRHGGLGLGLALVRHIVEAHGGTVRAASAGEGQGATFTVTLLIPKTFVSDSAAALEDATTSPKSPPTSGLAGLTILVIEDDADTRDLASLILSSAGATVTTASSTDDALVVLARERPSVVISDLAMPHTDGAELIRRIRTRTGAHGAKISVIALTEDARDYSHKQALEAGFDAHVAKPLDATGLSMPSPGLLTTPREHLRRSAHVSLRARIALPSS